LKENLAVPVDSLIARSYLEVVDEAGPVTQQHETFVTLQIHAGRSARAVKTAGGGDEGACEILRRELAALSTKLVSAEVTVDGALTPRLVARAIRTGFDPACRESLARVGSRAPGRDGTSIANAAPMATETSWSAYRSDGAWHRTYWIAEWPRIDADPDFLAPLMLRTERMRTVSLTMEPVSALKAIRSVESARTSAAADEELRNRAGFVTTARRLREQEALASHERDLGDGHAFYRFAGFVTVTATDPEELERACGEVEEAAGRSFLDLRRLSGEQDIAFTYTLPLCRGLR
nr:PrgI family protein [Actinomycetota bacterium]